MLSLVKSSLFGTGMAKYRNMEPKSIGVVSENVYSINDTVDTSAE